jgi:hypothetical protein
MSRKMGRPLIEIDSESFDKLCFMHCTESEIAGFFECSIDTIGRWCKRTYKTTFAELREQKASRGKVSLRRMQWKLAEKGDKTMLIWLGKQELGQMDKSREEITGKDGGPLEHIVGMSDDELERKAKQILSRRTGNTN